MTIVHSESPLIWLALLVGIVVVLSLLLSIVFYVTGDRKAAKQIVRRAVGGFVIWVVIANSISVLTPRTIVKIGETYCDDINCLGIDEVMTPTHPSDPVYRLKAHVYNDANTIKISFKGYSLYLMDERGRRFPLVKDPSVIPYDLLLDPGQSINTTLTFEVAPDVRQLFLKWEDTGPHEHIGGKKPPSWLVPVLPIVALTMYGGGGFLLQKQTLLRVL
jgi:hypothetical protein